MRRILSIAFAAALLGQAAIYAQDSGEPSEQSVLDAARAKYRAGQQADQAPEAQAEPQAEPQAAEAPADQGQSPGNSQDERIPYTPILVSFVPGVSFPFGTYDVAVAGGMIGALTRDVSGAEASGVFNLARDVRGAQGAGVFNIARGLRGVQGSGVFNMADGEVSGAQGSGVFNIAGNLRGAQGSGVFNIARDVDGIQGAGVFNIAGDVSGVQAAGVFNSARSVRGVQVGVVNVADNVDGAQIGLINIARNGIRSTSLVYEPDSGYAYAFWQAGTPYLYTLAGLGAPLSHWEVDPKGATASLGLGSRSRLFCFTIDTDISAESAIGDLPYGSFDWKRDWGEWEGWSLLRPYPSLRIEASVPVGFHCRLVAGLKADVDVDALGERVPAALKAGGGWRGSLFDGGFTVWPKWFFGLKM